MKHEEIKDLVAAYVLGAVSSREVLFVRSHIMSCEECMADADAYASIASELALAVTPVPLPKGFADAVVKKATGAAAPSRSARRWHFSLVSALSVAAALVAFAIMTTQVIQTRHEIDRRGRVMSALLHSEEGVSLSGDGAVARMVPTNEGSIFVASGLHEAPSNYTYQLWLLDEGQPDSVATFDVEDGVAFVESGIDMSDYESAAVTLEPAGGSAKPSDTVVLSASV